VPELSDEKIMLLVKEGRLSELTELFERYHVPLYNFFLRLTLDGPLSEDLTQNLFCRIIRYRQSFEPTVGSFRSWVYRMARNVYADNLRQERKVPDRGEIPEEASERLAGHEAGYSEDQYERLDAAMARLSPDQREILVLSRYQGLKYGEISKIKGISIPAIKVQVYRALQRLRSLYFKHS
jgi:RNA polymerase sigma-70 factor (ECF subfamily)